LFLAPGAEPISVFKPVEYLINRNIGYRTFSLAQSRIIASTGYYDGGASLIREINNRETHKCESNAWKIQRGAPSGKSPTGKTGTLHQSPRNRWQVG
jgi:hypothetical protein